MARNTDRQRLPLASAESTVAPTPAGDAVILCKGWDEAELDKILADFRSMYQDQLASKSFDVERHRSYLLIRFPNDLEPELLSLLVNYLQYPKGVDLANRDIVVLGLVTLTRAFPLPHAEYAGKKARIYVPSDDRKYDEVYIEVDSEFFRQSFTNMAWRAAADGRIPDGVKDLCLCSPSSAPLTTHRLPAQEPPIESKPLSFWFSRIPMRARVAAILAVCAGSFFLAVHFEPQSPAVCDHVRVLGVVRCGNSQCFVVRYMSTGERRSVGTFGDRPFDVNFVGPAAMITTRGKWTGAYHFDFKYSCEPAT